MTVGFFQEISMAASESEGLEITPSEVYSRLKSQREIVGKNGLDTYTSFSIMSGAFHKMPGIERNAAIGLNRNLADGIWEILAAEGVIDEENSVRPSSLQIPGWGHREYMLLWYHVVSGVPAGYAAEVESTTDLIYSEKYGGRGVFNDFSFATADRADDMILYTKAYLDAIEPHRKELCKVKQVIRLFGEDSVGSKGEFYLAKELEIPVYKVKFESPNDPRLNGTGDLLRDLASIGGIEFSNFGNGKVFNLVNASNGLQEA